MNVNKDRFIDKTETSGVGLVRCSWKGQLERRAAGKSIAGKFRFMLESTERSWKISLKLASFATVGMMWLKLEITNEHGKFKIKRFR